MMGQNLQQLMRDNRKELLDQWFHQFIGAYPPESVKYFERVENEFTNPIGSNVHRSLVAIFDELLGQQDADKLYGDLEMIMRIKAVQDVTPSQAIAFVFGLKSILRKAFTKEINNGTIKLSELLDFEDSLDTMALLAFNIYVDSRELIYDMRVQEMHQRIDILEKANLLNEKVDTSTFMRCSNYMEMPESEKE